MSYRGVPVSVNGAQKNGVTRIGLVPALVPSLLLRKAERVAQEENRTKSELLREASASFYLWAFALEGTTPTRVAGTITVNPVMAAALAAALLGSRSA